MDILIGILVILHFLGLAGLIGGFAAVMKKPTVGPAMLHGAITQIVTGVLLVGIYEMGDGDIDHMKIGVKLLVAIVVLIAAIIGIRSTETNRSATMAKVAGGLAVLNVAIAVLWV